MAVVNRNADKLRVLQNMPDTGSTEALDQFLATFVAQSNQVMHYPCSWVTHAVAVTHDCSCSDKHESDDAVSTMNAQKVLSRFCSKSKHTKTARLLWVLPTRHSYAQSISMLKAHWAPSRIMHTTTEPAGLKIQLP